MTDLSVKAAISALASASDVEIGGRSAPAQVYRDADVDEWIVEAPNRAVDGLMTFTGPQAQHRALTFAHEKFGSARFFPY